MEMFRCANCMEALQRTDTVCPYCGFSKAAYEQQPSALGLETILAGRYLTGRVLGQGGFGITYVGYDLKLQMKVAIKEYYPVNMVEREHSISNSLHWTIPRTQYLDRKNGMEHFLSEARKMAKLDDLPGIVRVRDSFEENNTAYIVMDFANGVTLKRCLQENGKLDYRSCFELLAPILDSLETMHAKGMIHRDISPDNIMVSRQGKKLRAKLLDFGATVDLRAGHTGQTEAVVKRGYSAPEQYMDEGQIGRWTDVYAMAGVIYYCLTLREPPEAMERITQRSKLDLKGISGRRLQQTLAKALTLMTENRTQSMAELKAALQKCLPSNKLPLVIAAGAAAAVAAGVAGVLLVSFKPWLPTAETLGTSNANMKNGSNCIEISGEYIYFVDEEFQLYVSEYDQEDETFYMGGQESLDNEAGYLVRGADKIYYIHDNEETPDEQDAIIEMDLDGSNKKTLLNDNEYAYLQYVSLSNGDEMLYYMQENDTEDDLLYTLCRYDLASGETETLLEEDIYWYNIDGKYLYYITFTLDDLKDLNTSLKCAYLNGKHAVLLNDTDGLDGGFIEAGKLYTRSLKDSRLRIYDVDGAQVTKSDDTYEKAIDEDGDIFNSASFTYGDGWLFYTVQSDDGSVLCRRRADGTGEVQELYSTKKDALVLTYCNRWLHTLIGEFDTSLENGYAVYQTVLVPYDGSGSEFVLNQNTTEDGLVYMEEDGEVTVTGYTGDASYVVIPWIFDEGEWNGTLAETFPDDVTVYITAKESELTYEETEDGDGYVLLSYSGEVTGDCANLAIPASIGDMPVKELGEEFMQDNDEIERLVLLEGLETIGTKAFDDCDQLESVVLPEGLQAIGARAFCNTALTEIELPASVETLGYAFCVGLTSISVAEGNETLYVEDGVLYSDSYKGTILWLVPVTKEGSFVVPSDVVSIASYAFAYSQITSVTVPNSVTSIGNSAFYRAEKLEEAVLQEGVQEIGKSSFRYCISLKDIYIPGSVTTIQDKAFSECTSLRSVTISEDCEIGEEAFDSGVTVSYYE